MDLQHNTIEIIHQNLDTTMQMMDQLSETVADCAMQLAQCLLGEHKILVCGEGSASALAQIFSAQLLNRFNHERPSLPAVCLSTDSATLSAIAVDGSFNDVFAKQIRALGAPGDILVSLSNSGGAGVVLQAIQAAHDRDMTVICLNSQDGDKIAALLLPDDQQISIPSSSRARVIETQLLVINCLCQLIDTQLFGYED